MICKEKFVKYANALRKHYSWLNKLYDLGVNIDSEPLASIEDAIYDVILEGNTDYDYDDYGGIGWVAYWCSSDMDQKGFRRVKDYIHLPDAGALYDFVSEMAESGWPEKVREEWIV